MSDGPCKTLPMPPKWRALSRRADNPAFAIQEVADAVCPALAADWSAEISQSLLRQLRRVLDEGASPLFPGDLPSAVERLRPTAASPLDALLVDAACDASHDGMTREAALHHAVTEALLERALRDIRQVEEHWLRETPQRRAANVRARLEAAVAAAGISELAARLLGGTGAREVQAERKGGVDDGVSLER